MFNADIAIEMFFNLFQSIMYVGFPALFFESKYNKHIKRIAFISFVFFQFINISFFSFTSYKAVGVYYIDVIAYIFVIELYTIIFCKGNLSIRILLPFISHMIVVIATYLCSFAFSMLVQIPFEELATEGSIFRYLCMLVINITIIFVYFLIVKFSSKKIKITKWTDVAAFVIIPLLVIIIIFSTLSVFILCEYQTNVMIFLVVICASMIAVAVISWVMMARISKDNEIKTKLLLTEQREQLYESNILQSSAQIEKISKIKHDMKNNLLCIGNLINSTNYEEARSLCSEVFNNLSGVYTPINSDNPLLNAVVNVELEKAVSEDIDFKILITDNLTCITKSSDIISIVGNMCDNAIEYLKTLPPDMREMYLKIAKKNDYCLITCRNRIAGSVLENNPSLKTKKLDKDNHGMGTNILKNIAQKYDGTTKYDEENGNFTVSVLLKVM